LDLLSKSLLRRARVSVNRTIGEMSDLSLISFSQVSQLGIWDETLSSDRTSGDMVTVTELRDWRCAHLALDIL
jgi:hypothetical protein